MVEHFEQPPTAKRFLLRKGGQWPGGIPRLALLVPLLLLLASTGIPALVPFRAPVSVALLTIEACLVGWVSVRAWGGSKPVLALSMDGGIATLDRLQPPVPGVACAALTPGRIEHARWLPPKGTLYCPKVRITLDPVWRLEIGAPLFWAGTHGPSDRQPTYVIEASEWPAFIAALTAACEVNQRSVGQRS